MSQLLLPATINPPRFHKDGSVALGFETRELKAEEILTIMGYREISGWLAFAPNEGDIHIPEERADVELKTPSERLRNALYRFYMYEVDKGHYTGLFESFRAMWMEKIIKGVLNKID